MKFAQALASVDLMRSFEAPTGVDPTNLFGAFGVTAIGNGYPAFPIPPGGKKTSWREWTKWCGVMPNQREVERWASNYPAWSVAIACGQHVVAIDIDETDEERAVSTEQLVFAVLGPSPLVRIGRAPRRLLVYAVCGKPPATSRQGKTEILGHGAYFVASGIHPDTKTFYQWLVGSPISVPIDRLPVVDKAGIDRLRRILDASEGRGAIASCEPASMTDANSAPVHIDLVSLGPWVIDKRGIVVDGRDAFLARLVWEAAKQAQEASSVAQAAWARFQQKADQERPRRDGSRAWSFADALVKAQALLRSGKVAEGARADGLPTENGFWTEPTKHAFGHIVNAAGAAGLLSPSTVTISRLMLSLVHGNGACFASVATIASDLDLSISTVKKAKRKLRQAGFWTSLQDLGGRGYIASYRPNPEALGFTFVAPSKTKTVDTKGTMIFQGEGGNDWGDLLLEQNEKPGREEVESRSVSPECRDLIGTVPYWESPKCR